MMISPIDYRHVDFQATELLGDLKAAEAGPHYYDVAPDHYELAL